MYDHTYYYILLRERQVPDIASPICVCGDGRETATHVAAYCLQEGDARRELPFAMQTCRDFDMAVEDPTRAAHLTRLFMRRRRIGGCKMALQIMDSDDMVAAPPLFLP
jgi:hypothetical protein